MRNQVLQDNERRIVSNVSHGTDTLLPAGARDFSQCHPQSLPGPDFHPLPFLSNPHVQTMLGVWLRGSTAPLNSREHRVLLDDGDCLIVHDSQSSNWRDGGPIALVVHGLGGSHRSSYVQRLARLLLKRGVRVGCVDLRGCGRGVTLAKRSYHAGCSDDIRAAAIDMLRDSPHSPLFLIGLSLGGNIVLKLAGECGARPLPNLTRVAAVAPPIDLAKCCEMFARPRNRLYELHFLRDLIAQVRQRQQHFPELRRYRFPKRLTLRLFDDIYTAPLNGFAGAEDYYHRAASLPYLKDIPVPTLILTARDDPIIAVEPFENLKVPIHVKVHVARHGGHLGFLGWDGVGGIRWGEQRVAEWIAPIV